MTMTGNVEQSVLPESATKRPRWLLIFLVLSVAKPPVLLGLAVAFWSVGSSAESTKTVLRADPENARQVALGREIYTRRCADCHGKQLAGQPNWQIRKPDGRLPALPLEESGHAWHHSDQHLFQLVKHGVYPFAAPGYESDMPAFGGVIADEEIWAALAFIKNSWPPNIRDHQRGIQR